jgi:hypothetical protein
MSGEGQAASSTRRQAPAEGSPHALPFQNFSGGQLQTALAESQALQLVAPMQPAWQLAVLVPSHQMLETNPSAHNLQSLLYSGCWSVFWKPGLQVQFVALTVLSPHTHFPGLVVLLQTWPAPHTQLAAALLHLLQLYMAVEEWMLLSPGGANVAADPGASGQGTLRRHVALGALGLAAGAGVPRPADCAAHGCRVSI